jgi:beta-glucuronidase
MLHSRSARTVLVLACALGLGVGAARAQLTDPPILLEGRERVSLTTHAGQTWRYLVEPFGQSVRSRNDRRDFPADRLAREGEILEYEWPSAPEIEVPGDFNHQDPQLWLYEGTLWYRTRFDAPAAAAPDAGAQAERVFLYLHAANYLTHVFLNGEKLAQHEGGFLPFAVEVTGRLKASDNSLVVAVDNTRRESGIPGRRTDWWNYGGLTRPVELVVVPSTYVHDLRVRYDDATGAADAPRIDLVAEIDGPEAPGARVVFAVPELGLSRTVRADAEGRASASFELGALPQRWAPGSPKRYAVVAETDGDRVTDYVGFRTLRAEGQRLLLNGEPLFLRGVAMHEEAFDAQGRRATGREDYLALLESARSLGSNFVRLAHYPYGEDMLKLADSLGLVVWSEVPIYWEEIDFASAQTLELARSMMRRLVDRDENRAAVAIWSVANETPVTEPRMLFLRTLIEDVRAQDPTRLVSAALKSSSIEAAAADGAGGAAPRQGDTGSRSNSLTQRVDDPLGRYLDVLAVNTYVGWYGSRTPDEIREVTWETPYDKPIVFTEFGAGALRGLRGGRLDRWTEEYQAALIDETMAVALRTPGVVGTSPWVLKDFRSPRRWHPRYQQFWNRKGLVDELGREKLAASVLRRWHDALARGQRPTSPLGITP